MNKTIYRYKAFNDNLKSVIGTQFKISKTYEIKVFYVIGIKY